MILRGIAVNGKRIGYLGPCGTYSGLAAEKLHKGATLVAYPSFFTLFSVLKEGGVDAIVIPIENTLNGAVTQNFDLLQEAEGVCATASCAVRIDHRLITQKGADLSQIKRIYSHPQALAQCGKYLAENFPNAELKETSSTAECIGKLSAGAAGIVGAHCEREGFTLSEECISDELNNYTQFLSAERGEPAENAYSDRVFFSVTCRHCAGALVDLLTVLKRNGINMTEIESRPIKNRPGEFRFFVEIEGNYADGRVKAALEALKESAHSFKLLGSYVCGLPE